MSRRDTQSVDPVNAVVIAATVIGSVGVIGAIVLVICCVAYFKERLFNNCHTDAPSIESHVHTRRRRRRRRRRHRDVESEPEAEERHTQDLEIQLEDSELQPHRPPPSYNRATEYSSVETDTHVYTDEQTSTHVTMYIDDEDPVDSTMPTDLIEEHGEVEQNEVACHTPQETLPPTYSTIQLEAMAVRREVIELEGGRRLASHSLSLEEEDTMGEGPMPPSYSTAQLELLKSKADMEQGISSSQHS